MRPRLTYANVTATLALVFAICGGAWAVIQLPRNSVRSLNIKNGQVKARDIGNNQVHSSDIKNNEIKSEDIRDGQVSSADIGDGQVSSADIGAGQVTAAGIGAGAVTSTGIGPGQVKSANIGDGEVGAAELAPDEPFHLVGATDEPAFGDGGAGDCLWNNFTQIIGPPDPFNPVGFYKDAYGVVHLTGAAKAKNGSGGDGSCGTANSDGDGTIFILPAADRPPHELVFTIAGGSGGASMETVGVVGASDINLGGGIVFPAGAVIASDRADGTTAFLDGVDFRAAGSDTGIP